MNFIQNNSSVIGGLLKYEVQLDTRWYSALISEQNKCFTNILLQEFGENSSSFWGYEVKLNASNVAPDFLICIDSARKVSLYQSLASPFFELKYWQGLIGFVEKWQHNDSIFCKDVSNIWLEFDQKQMAAGFYSPSLFLAPSPLYRGKDLAQLAKETFEPIIGKSLNRVLVNNCIKAYDSLPSNAWIPQFGMMLPRTTERLRMYIQNMDATQTANYLDRMGWRHNVQMVQNEIDNLLKFCKKVDLDIDLGESIGDTIGLECYFSHNDFDGMRKMAFYFVEKGLAVLSQVNSLFIYIGQMQEVALKGAFKNEYFHHFKITYNPAAISEAKVYLAIRNN